MKSIVIKNCRKFLTALIVGSMLFSTACPAVESSETEKESRSAEIVETEEDEQIDFSKGSIPSITVSQTASESEEPVIPATVEIPVIETEESSVETTTENTTEETTSVVTSETTVQELPEDSEFWVEYIDVGQGDASLIICDDEAMLIDGGASDKSDLIYTYLKNEEIEHLKYIVATHPDDDHIGGLPGALKYATVERAFCSVDEYDSKPFSSFQKYLNKQQVVLEIPTYGTELSLGSASVQFLGPISIADDTNNNSLVIRVVYGNTSFLFTGDAEFDEENALIRSGQDLYSDVIKIGHHGSEYSTSESFLTAVDPLCAIISCGKDNAYGFPKQSVLDQLKAREIEVFRTDLHGDIILFSDGETISLWTEKETTEDVFLAPGVAAPIPEGQNDCEYIANTNTHKFHYPDCSAVKKMKEKNKWYYTGDREDLITLGYQPCKICNP